MLWEVVSLSKQVTEFRYWTTSCAVFASVIAACSIERLVIVPSIYISINFVVAWMNNNHLRMPWITFVTIVYTSPGWESSMMSSRPM